MNCVPGKTLLIGMAALAVNAAAASGINLIPAELFIKSSAGETSFVLEKQWFTQKKSSKSALPTPADALDELTRGHRSKAAALLRQIAADEKNPAAFQARLLAGQLAGSTGNWFNACNWFAAADVPGAPADICREAKIGMIHALLKMGQYGLAESVLRRARSEFAADGELWDKFSLITTGLKGDWAALEKSWERNYPKFLSGADEGLFEALTSAAAAAEKSNQLNVAEKFSAAAYEFAPDNTARRNCFRQLIGIQEKYNAARALRSIDKYLLFFPDAPDAGSVRLCKGMILNREKNFQEALNIFRGILNDKKCTPAERVHAALYAAVSAENLGDLSMARELYNSAIRRFGSQPELANQVKISLLEFLVRTKDYSPAAVLGEELAGAVGVDQDQLNSFRLTALIELKRYTEAADIAVSLSRSADPAHSAEGAWQLARLTELQQKLSAARQLYLQFANKFPKDNRAPDACLAAAQFALQLRDFQAAGTELEKFADAYTKHPERRKALLGALYAFIQLAPELRQGKDELLLKKISSEFTGTLEYDQAVIEYSRSLVKNRNYTEALKYLEKFLRERTDSSLIPEALCLGAELFEKIGNHTKAVEYADRILDKFPNSHLAVDAAMLGGRCSFQSGNYSQALKYYERAGELGGRGVIGLVASGEAADCHLMLRKAENLRSAINIYRKLSDNAQFPALQAQALFKLGSAYEQAGDNMKALQAYEELLSRAVASVKMRQSSGVAPWCSRSAHGALRLILGAPQLPDGSQRAQRICRLYSLLNLPGSSAELNSYLEEIRKHYNLLD